MTAITQRIVPHLWFDTQAKEASEFYASLFPESAVLAVTTLHGTPSGDCELVSLQLWGQRFAAISAGPYFQFNPSISFIVNFDPPQFASPSPRQAAKAALENVWATLSAGGKVLMPLDEYPFSKAYGCVQDKYGLSWQLALWDSEGEPRPAIVPSLLFVGGRCGKAEEAGGYYASIFRNARLGELHRYPAGQAPNREGTVMYADVMLESSWFAIMDSALEHDFGFNEATSFMLNCNTQEEIDYYWHRLSAVPEAEQCGWLKDKYGISWQIVPAELEQMIRSGTPKQRERITQAFLGMKKFDIAALRDAFRSR